MKKNNVLKGMDTLRNVLSIKLQKGGILERKGVSVNDKNYWNNFIDYLSRQEFSIDDFDNTNTNLNRNLWQEYGKTIGEVRDYDKFIPKIQEEIIATRYSDIDHMKNGKAKLKGFTKEEILKDDFDWDSNYLRTLPAHDGIMSSKMIKFKLPTRKKYLYEPLPKQEEPVRVEETDVEKFANGGSIENVIVSGVLHSRNSKVKQNEEYSNAKLTKKGVPVVVKEDGGSIEQVAEVEREELILHKDLTEKIEKLYEDGSEDAMIEAGKILSEELTKNIKDNTNVIAKIEKDEESKDND